MSFRIVSPIDRIRGSQEIPIVVSCTFLYGQREVEVSGVYACLDPAKLEEATLKAIENARTNLQMIQETPSRINEALSKLIKATISTEVTRFVKTAPQGELTKMYEPCGDHTQDKITGLCETLGIDIIDVSDFLYVEALVLIEYLEKLARPVANV